MRRGLVVGKFMPLHRGHQLLIETALAQSDEVTVVVYDEFIDSETAKLMPGQKRANWITTLYPSLHDVVVLQDPLSGSYADHDEPRFAKLYAEQVSFLGPFTHVFSSEEYGAPFARELSAFGVFTEHVMVDAARDLVPFSGTMFRSDPYAYRAFVDPLVYRSLIQKVVFVGTESTGKSTLARQMAEIRNTRYTEEYGRTLWARKAEQGIKPTFHDLLVTGQTQYEQEQAAALHSNRYLFCDTNAWTTMLWSEWYHSTADARLTDLAERTKNEYRWFFCRPDFGWVNDGLRELANGEAARFDEYHRKRLAESGIWFTEIGGDPKERLEQVSSLLDRLIVV